MISSRKVVCLRRDVLEARLLLPSRLRKGNHFHDLEWLLTLPNCTVFIVARESASRSDGEDDLRKIKRMFVVGEVIVN